MSTFVTSFINEGILIAYLLAEAVRICVRLYYTWKVWFRFHGWERRRFERMLWR